MARRATARSCSWGSTGFTPWMAWASWMTPCSWSLARAASAASLNRSANPTRRQDTARRARNVTWRDEMTGRSGQVEGGQRAVGEVHQRLDVMMVGTAQREWIYVHRDHAHRRCAIGVVTTAVADVADPLGRQPQSLGGR